MTEEQSEIEEFFEIVGTKKLPEYHFYYLDNGILWGIRLDNRKPKPGNLPWPIVWKRSNSSERLRLAIMDQIRKGKAAGISHTDEERWRGRDDH